MGQVEDIAGEEEEQVGDGNEAHPAQQFGPLWADPTQELNGRLKGKVRHASPYQASKTGKKESVLGAEHPERFQDYHRWKCGPTLATMADDFACMHCAKINQKISVSLQPVYYKYVTNIFDSYGQFAETPASVAKLSDCCNSTVSFFQVAKRD